MSLPKPSLAILLMQYNQPGSRPNRSLEDVPQFPSPKTPSCVLLAKNLAILPKIAGYPHNKSEILRKKTPGDDLGQRTVEDHKDHNGEDPGTDPGRAKDAALAVFLTVVNAIRVVPGLPVAMEEDLHIAQVPNLLTVLDTGLILDKGRILDNVLILANVNKIFAVPVRTSTKSRILDVVRTEIPNRVFPHDHREW
jgi:hypothetical protein